ncbi:relaxase domain-containing protein [Rhodococcus hoagii]|nr:relaxase domain-containing protein [Prescottella equi]
MGSGLESLTGVESGETVSAEQMRALFGEGRHPNATAIEENLIAAAVARGLDKDAASRQALVETKLGNPFRIYQGETEFRQVVAERFAAHNVARGESANARIDDATRAEIRTQVGQELFAKEYGRSPADAAELSGFIARGSRQKTTAVAGYDLTFTPVKSVSTLWAVAPARCPSRSRMPPRRRAEGDRVRREERHLHPIGHRWGAAGRRRRAALRRVHAPRFACRRPEPAHPRGHLEQVRATDSGRWLALDGRPLHKLFVAASEFTTLSSRVRCGPASGCSSPSARRREGQAFHPRNRRRRRSAQRGVVFPAGHDRGPPRRTRRPVPARARREPTPIEAIALAQQANLETREAKHEPKSHAEQREEWRATALQVLGGEQGLSDMVRTATQPRRSITRTTITGRWIQESAEQIIETVSEHQSRWQDAHLIAEAQRVARAANLPRTR